ncbi:MAG: helix-turn-helix domain-containing protein [Gammaproteobacteria bacterium]|nr:MAG: helix-turn-helix domain-containing protein [Gammaproteobacteria bacterium]
MPTELPDLNQQNRVGRAWHRLVRSGELAANAVRPLVHESWLRCYRAGVDPGCARITQSKADSRGLHPHERELLDVGTGVMARARDFLRESGTIMVLANAAGVVLSTEEAGSGLEAAAETGVRPGAEWTELARGTNSIGTALRTAVPVHIHGSEHYCDSVKSWTCAAAVIRDPTDDTVRGAVSVAGLSGAFNRHLLALAVATSGHLEAALNSRELQRRERLLEYGLGRLSQSASNRVILFDRHGRVVRAGTGAGLTLAQMGIETSPRVEALDVDAATLAGGAKLPVWLRPEWLEPVMDSDDRKAMAYIEVHIGRAIRLEQVAFAAGVSPFHFHRQFKRATGLTPHQYTVRLRIERAKALLCRSELTITEVAARVGFTDQSHFTTIFRRMTSMTPGNYRNAMSV